MPDSPYTEARSFANKFDLFLTGLSFSAAALAVETLDGQRGTFWLSLECVSIATLLVAAFLILYRCAITEVVYAGPENLHIQQKEVAAFQAANGRPHPKAAVVTANEAKLIRWQGAFGPSRKWAVWLFGIGLVLALAVRVCATFIGPLSWRGMLVCG